MPRSYQRFTILIGALISLLLIMSLLYMLGMYFLEGKPRDFMQALQWAAGTASTTGYGGDTSWQHPVMVIYVVFAQFIGVILLFLVFPIYLIPFLEERFETKLPKESANSKNHVVIFDYDSIQDNATWEDALQTPSGISHVIVNGTLVAEDGKHTGQT